MGTIPSFVGYIVPYDGDGERTIPSFVGYIVPYEGGWGGGFLAVYEMTGMEICRVLYKNTLFSAKNC